MAQASNSSGRAAIVLVLLVGALVSTAEAARNSDLGAGSAAAAAPLASVHPMSFLGCIMGCGSQLTMCGVACINKPLLQAPQCGLVCAEYNTKCLLACGAGS